MNSNRARLLMLRFRKSAELFGETAVSADGCLLFQTRIGGEHLIVQLDPYQERLTLLGELENPTWGNSYPVEDAHKLLKALLTTKAYNEEKGTSYGWKTIV